MLSCWFIPRWKLKIIIKKKNYIERPLNQKTANSDNKNAVLAWRMRTIQRRRCMTGNKWAVPLVTPPCRNQWWLIAAIYPVKLKTSSHRCFCSIARNNLIGRIPLALLTFSDRCGVVHDTETVTCFWIVRSKADKQRLSGGSDVTWQDNSTVRAKKRCWRTGAIVDLNAVIGTIILGLDIETREV